MESHAPTSPLSHGNAKCVQHFTIFGLIAIWVVLATPIDLPLGGCFVELGESAGWHFSGEKWALWAKKWLTLHIKHIAGLLITCLGPCKQPNACRHASSLAFFENVMLQQQRMHSTKWAARTQKNSNRVLGAANWPI